MKKLAILRATLAGGVCALALATAAHAQGARPFDLPAAELSVALDAYIRQSGAQLIYQPSDVRGRRSTRVSGSLTPEEALDRLLAGTGLRVARDPTGAMMIVRPQSGATDAAGTTDATQVGDVVVTGSHIRGAIPAAPVHVVSREDIDRSGYGSVGDIMRSLPENFSGGQNPGVIASTAGNPGNQNLSDASSVNLRGLGTDATLVLVNGRRLGGDALSQGTDISGIPMAALRRIEIVTDGSSAIYGADAVAGVANFILRKDFHGAEVSARLGQTTQGGGFEQTYSALAGMARGKLRAMVNVEHADQSGILASERDVTADVTPQTSLIKPSERTSVFASAGVDLTDRLSISLDALRTERSSSYDFQTTPIAAAYRYETATEAQSFSGSVDVNLPGDWEMHLLGSTFDSRFDQFMWNGPTVSLTVYEQSVRYAELGASGSLGNLPSGPVRLAVGGGHREEEFDRPGASPLTGARQIDYVFGELLVPLVSPSTTRTGLQQLDLSLSGRYEEYSDFGTTSTPKIGVRYIPLEGLTFRGTWGESFKAASFVQLNSSKIVALYPSSTFGRAGGTSLFVTGGNPGLRPEQSTSWTFGVEYQPPQVPSFSVAATYFDIDYTDRIVTPITPTAAALTEPRFAPFILLNPSAAIQAAEIAGAGRFVNASGGTYDPANVAAILFNTYANATAQKVRGVDLSYRQTFDLGSGHLMAFGNATWTDLRQATLPTTPEIALSGTVGNVPKYRVRGGMTWSTGGLAATGIVNFLSDGRDTGMAPVRDIESWTTIDTTVAYRFADTSSLRGVTLTLSVSNLLDADPPYVESPSRQYRGVVFDSTNASAVGRLVSLTARKRF